MSTKKILAIGIDWFPGDDRHELISCVPFQSHVSLIDADIVILAPSLSSYPYDTSDSYKGKECLTDNGSGRFEDDVTFWRAEISRALEAGKTIFFLSEKPHEFYYATGTKDYSGTGKNQRVTRHVALFNSYSIFPVISDRIHASAGSEIAYRSTNAVLRGLWEENRDYFHYEVCYSADTFKHQPIFYQKKGKDVLGGILTLKSGGVFVVLPALELEHPNFSTSKTNSKTGIAEQHWTKEAAAFTNRIIKSLVGIDGSLRKQGTQTPPPQWSEAKEYELKEVVEICKDIANVERQIEDLQKAAAQLLERKTRAEVPIRLLFESGKPLEASVREVLTLMGFSAEAFNDGESDFDVVFRSSEGNFLGEVEGKDNKAVDVTKISQLIRNLGEYVTKDNVTEPAKGVLFGNGYRLQEPNLRPPEFTDKCIKVSQQSNIALVKTSDLFSIARILSSNPDEALKRTCREAVLNTKGGLVAFPKDSNVR